jgi:glycosyl transferase family 25
MRILVINLDRSPERLVHVTGQFSQRGLSFERVSAVDGRILGDDVLALQPVSKLWKRMNKAEIACFMSHRKCWQLIAAGPDAYGAVIEDDVFFSPDAASGLSSSDWIPAAVGLLKIETFRQKVFLSRSQILADSGRSVHELRGCHVGTGGYVISRAYAEQLLALSDGSLPCPVDHFMFDDQVQRPAGFNVHQLVPAICIQGILLDSADPAHGSTIRKAPGMAVRAKRKLAPHQKLWREVKRLSLQAAALPPFLLRSIRYRWTVVPFG